MNSFLSPGLIAHTPACSGIHDVYTLRAADTTNKDILPVNEFGYAITIAETILFNDPEGLDFALRSPYIRPRVFDDNFFSIIITFSR
jgi:hypothetical protein